MARFYCDIHERGYNKKCENCFTLVLKKRKRERQRNKKKKLEKINACIVGVINQELFSTFKSPKRLIAENCKCKKYHVTNVKKLL